MRQRVVILFAGLTLVTVAGLSDERPAPATGRFFQQYCLRCHGPEKQEADFSVAGLSSEVQGDNLDAFERALEMVSIGDMPPEDEPQPSNEARSDFINSVTAQLKLLGRGATAHELQLPKFANRIDHDELFNGRQKGPAFTPARVWRMNGHI